MHIQILRSHAKYLTNVYTHTCTDRQTDRQTDRLTLILK